MLVANSSAIKEYKSNWFILLIILSTTFIPSYGNFALAKLIIIFIIWCFKTANSLDDQHIISYKIKSQRIILLWFLSIFLAAGTVLVVESSLNYGTILHELSRVAYYLFLLSLCFKISVSLRVLFYICSIIIIIHCAIQLSQYFSLGIVDNFIIQYYLQGDEGNMHYIMSMNNEEGGFRSGSIFINPNVYVCYPYLSLGVFLQYYRQTKGYLPVIMICIAFISILLTGSRMGMGSFLFILGWYFWFSSRHYENKFNFKGFTVIVVALVIGILYSDNLSNSLQDFRAFNFDSAYESSGDIKFRGFLGYLKVSYPLEWLFGSLGAPRLAIPIDMEWGYIFAWFGIFGLFWYLRLIKLIYDYHKRSFPIISSISAFSIILTAIGASSVLNMSVFPYICIISLTNLFSCRK